MRRRTFELRAGPLARQRLAELIRRFAAAAYPPGGSDCAQVARETLLDTAARIDGNGDSPVLVSTRQRPLLRQAVQWYFAEVSPGSRKAHEQPMLDLLAGRPVDDARFS